MVSGRARTAAVGGVAAQRVVELVISKRHDRALRARGAEEHGAGHYPVMVALHTLWLAATLVESTRWRRRSRRLGLIAGSVFVAAQPVRWWVIRSLGDRWTTRVLVVPGEPPVARGPYRVVRHPNYAIVVGEIATLPLALGAPVTAAAGSVANALLLRHRIRVEDAALGRRPPG